MSCKRYTLKTVAAEFCMLLCITRRRRCRSVSLSLCLCVYACVCVCVCVCVICLHSRPWTIPAILWRFLLAWRRKVFLLPVQLNPSPVYPGRQAHVKLPTLLVQLALALQPPLFVSHSLISALLQTFHMSSMWSMAIIRWCLTHPARYTAKYCGFIGAVPYHSSLRFPSGTLQCES